MNGTGTWLDTIGRIFSAIPDLAAPRDEPFALRRSERDRFLVAERVCQNGSRQQRPERLRTRCISPQQLERACKLFVIEANPNPQLAQGEDFAESAVHAGLSYAQLLDRIMNLGLQWQPERMNVG